MADNSDLYPRSFTVSLSETASESLVIPLPFMKFLADPLPKTVKLQGIGGKIFWTVSMKKISGAVYFTTGWPKFAKDHELKNGEFMTFVYDGHRTFEVSVLERFGCKETRAEIQAIQLSDSDFAVEDKEDSSDDDDDVFAGNLEFGSLTNPHFPYKLKNKKIHVLSIPAKVVKDNNLDFGSSINYIDGQGTLVRKRSKWAEKSRIAMFFKHVPFANDVPSFEGNSLIGKFCSLPYQGPLSINVLDGTAKIKVIILHHFGWDLLHTKQNHCNMLKPY